MRTRTAILLAEWALSQDIQPLEATAVPGATERERSALAAIGGVVAVVPGGGARPWPEAVRAWITSAPVPPPAIMNAVRIEIQTMGSAFLAAV
jgi:hypothetical protein